MRKVNSILAIILLVVVAGCGGDKQSTGDIITVDVTKSYPKKELILQDFLDVEYIALETNDDFVTQGFVRAIGKDIIIVTNHINDGDIFVFDRNGKSLKKINRKGEGGEEYLNITRIILDEDNNEMFVNDHYRKKILVYDLYGKFKRSFNYTENASYLNVFNYDKSNLICYDSSVDRKDGEERGNQSYHVIISKQDGSITREIHIPFQTIKSQMLRVTDATNNRTFSTHYSNDYQIIPYRGNWILLDLSADTVYSYDPNEDLAPFIVRTPSIHSMDPEVFLFLNILTDRYCFMKTVKKEFDFETMRGFPDTDLMYDRQENSIFEYTVYNDDYSVKTPVTTPLFPLNHKIAFWYKLESYQLVESYKKGELKGRLKEIAAELDEESNPVIMLVKHRE